MQENTKKTNFGKEAGRFLFYYLRSMRLYYGFVTGATVLLGLAAASVCFSKDPLPDWRGMTALILGFLAWGANQIFNDWGNLAEDRINAPERPMVTGKLAVYPALALSAALTAGFGAVSLFLNWLTLLPLALGVLLNLAYNWAKGVPVVGCAVYSLSITQCVLFGFLIGAANCISVSCADGISLAGSQNIPTSADVLSPASSPALSPASASAVFSPFIPAVLLVFLTHFTMCHFSYFKDREGDAAAGKRTLQVVCGSRFSLWFGLLPLAAVWGMLAFPGVFAYSLRLETAGSLWLTLCLYAAILREDYYSATRLNCQNCVWLVLAPLSAFWPAVHLSANQLSAFLPSAVSFPDVSLPAGFLAGLTACVCIRVLYAWYGEKE